MAVVLFLFFVFKQKTAYEMRISDWSSDVCSSDLDRAALRAVFRGIGHEVAQDHRDLLGGRVDDGLTIGGERVLAGCIPSRGALDQIGRASGRESVCPYV